MERFVLRLFLGLLVGFLFSCASAPTISNPYRPLSSVPNVNVIGIVQANFESVYNSSAGATSHISPLNQAAYIALLDAAKQEHTGNIDVVDIFYVFNRFERMRYQYTANGKVVSIGGGNQRNTATGVEGALARAANETLKNVPARSRIAIVYITAQDRSTTEYIAGELKYIWVNAGYTIIDRSQLDRIRREQNFQMSGEVDDDTAVSIGKIIGANIIVTGRVDGEGNLRRLRLRALDTQTAQVVGVASERL
jgi:hypothetical protein